MKGSANVPRPKPYERRRGGLISVRTVEILSRLAKGEREILAETFDLSVCYGIEVERQKRNLRNRADGIARTCRRHGYNVRVFTFTMPSTKVAHAYIVKD